MKKLLSVILLISMLLVAFASCSGEKESAEVEEILFEEEEITIKIGESVKLEALIYPRDARGADLEWESANEDVATVSNSGKVKGISEGTTIISAEAENGKYATCRVTVVKGDIEGGEETHKHIFIDGKCECGVSEPNYNPDNPHDHNHTFVDGKCECGEVDPNYVPPHEHNFIDGKCECGERDPNYNPDDLLNITYTITVSANGAPLANLPVYVYNYADGEIGYEIIAYAVTDKDGKAAFTLLEDSYAVKIDNGLPDGYEAEDYYIFDKDIEINLTSKIPPDTGLAGVSYSLGSIMHDFTVTTIDGETFTLSEVLKEKKAVVLNFWYTECGFCQMEFPFIQNAYEKYSDDIAVLALNPPSINGDTIFDIKQYRDNMGLTFDVALDYEGLYSAFGIEGYPTTIIIDRYGIVTLVQIGAFLTDRSFDRMFEYFTSDDYQHKLFENADIFTAAPKPDVEMPSSDAISAVFDKGMISGIEYRPYLDNASDEEKENSWPFIIDTFDLYGTRYDVLKASNSGISGSYAQMVMTVSLKAGEALAFDYFSSTELSSDVLHVVVNGKDIYSISGVSESWNTCYGYVAAEDGVYEVGFVYVKDGDTNIGDDTVYIKDLRIVSEDDVDQETYIFRYAAKKPNASGEYTEYVNIFLGADGYYHVGSANGPILLADLMGYTRFSSDISFYELANELYYNGKISYDEYERLIDYCNYASNSRIYGVCSVTVELSELLKAVASASGFTSDNKWLEFCCYYDAYGTNGKQLGDPIKGLAIFSAYDVIQSAPGDSDYPNSFTYDRLIMPRGYLAKFTPSVSGTYLISSYAVDPNNPAWGIECDGWILTEEGWESGKPWYVYENNDKQNQSDSNNVYMVVYLEAGKDYYIDIAFYDVYQTGTIYFRVERLGGEGYYKFSLASPPFFTAEIDNYGNSIIVSGGMDLELGSDGIWREKRTDGREGSILYADFTNPTPLFQSHSIQQMIELGAFDFSKSEEDQYVLNYLKIYDNDPAKCDAHFRELWGDTYDEYAEIYKLSDVYAGIYHGSGSDMTETARAYLSKVITAGYNSQLNENIEVGDERIGTVPVTAELAELLQALMDKYTFMNDTESVYGSWAKLCYYQQYFCSATPK